MGKITLAVLVAAIAMGVYWFWWYDQGANRPITVEGSFSVSGLAAMPGMQGPTNGTFILQAVPGKLKISGTVQGQRVSSIIRLDESKAYTVNEKSKVYAVEEFDLVDASETKLVEKGEETWPGWLKRTADWDSLGTGDDRRFSNKQTMDGIPKELMDTAKGAGESPVEKMMLAMAKDARAELWFTPETRLGKRYFSMLNKILRIRQVGTGVKQQEKRPRLQYVNLDFFPIPMKAVISLGSMMQLKMEVTSLSRSKIPKDVFEIPSGYRKVNKSEVTK